MYDLVSSVLSQCYIYIEREERDLGIYLDQDLEERNLVLALAFTFDQKKGIYL